MRRECLERFLRDQLQKKSLVSDPGMPHNTCVTHVPWCISESLTCSGRENVPGIPGACATRNFTHLVRGPWHCKSFEIRSPHGLFGRLENIGIYIVRDVLPIQCLSHINQFSLDDAKVCCNDAYIYLSTIHQTTIGITKQHAVILPVFPCSIEIYSMTAMIR